MIHFYNTLTKEKNAFEPLQRVVSVYSCGPTVYDYVHIGNLRSFLMWDVLRRTLEYNDYEVKHVMNITDVGHLVSDGDTGEDKMTKGLRREGMEITRENMLTLARKYEEAFKHDLSSLNILTPSSFPRASEHIEEDIDIIKALEEKGFTYKTSDGLYFDTTKDLEYGKLVGGISENGSSAEHARIGVNKEKQNPRDFALWKFNDSLGWDSPWGKGFPGWHIECSAMSEKHLGLPFDIHTGGVDHIAVHHTNEIAQTENARGTQMARVWLHNNFININDDKIAKSKGNTILLSDIEEKGFSPLSYRYLLLSGHYRTQMNFTWEALEAASNALNRLYDIVKSLPEPTVINEEYQEKFLAALNDDLNTPQALAVVWDVIRDESIELEAKKATLLDFDRVLGLKLSGQIKVEVPEEVQVLVDAREKARENKDFEKADAIRGEIEEHGYTVLDAESGPTIKQIKG